MVPYHYTGSPGTVNERLHIHLLGKNSIYQEKSSENRLLGKKIKQIKRNLTVMLAGRQSVKNKY